MTSIKGVLFLKNVDGEMKWGNGDSGNEDSGNEDSGNEDSGNGDSGNEDSGNEDSGIEDSGNEGKYEGEIENWEPNGIGNITYLIGIKYVGEWKNKEKWNGIGYDKIGDFVVRFVNGEQQ